MLRTGFRTVRSAGFAKIAGRRVPGAAGGSLAGHHPIVDCIDKTSQWISTHHRLPSRAV